MKVKKLIIEGCNKEYTIDEYGNVFDIARNTYRKPTITKKGYLRISFFINGKQKGKFVHRLVLQTFNPVNGMDNLQVNHIDCNKQNNHISNLEWCTQSENQKHAFKNGLISRQGEKNSQSFLTENDVLEILNLLKEKVPIQKIADKFSVSKCLISAIRNKRLWKHLSKDFKFPRSKYKANSLD